MTSSAESLYASLSGYDRIADLIAQGEAEGQFLECKAPQSPMLERGLKHQLSVGLSSFANAGGGVILWGVGTDSHVHSGLDVLTQIEPIGTCAAFAKRVDRAIMTLAIPAVQCPPSRVLLAKPTDSKGIVATFVPATAGDPVQALEDRRFYLRIGAADAEMPYATLKRMFAGADAPDLEPMFSSALVKREAGGTWLVPFAVANRSTKAATDTFLSLEVVNPSACESIQPVTFADVSTLNPGKRIYHLELSRPLHRGITIVAGYLRIAMKKGKRPKRVLNFALQLFATGMRAREWTIRVQLANKGFTVRRVRDRFLY